MVRLQPSFPHQQATTLGIRHSTDDREMKDLWQGERNSFHSRFDFWTIFFLSRQSSQGKIESSLTGDRNSRKKIFINELNHLVFITEKWILSRV